ncbi:FcoT family thioesterase [Streptomyces sp. NBC_01485]|uniref:FcoT family thioesterase n=1 Tax=Streptomyces sp. NBC_01485 TaxID=2903884 RepID=UPI002E35E034|nr:FcoT family thioesterase [Streptomyces sp. NBC_01485]
MSSQPPPTVVADQGSVVHENDAELLEKVLVPYKPNCRYLKSAELSVATESGGDAISSIRCAFEIPESCYIDDTGHFNAVEFNICYNQMVYYILAKSVKEGVAEPFDSWTMEQFWERQLPDMFIIDYLHSSFRRRMNGKRFWGELKIVGTSQWEGIEEGPWILIDTTCRFWEESGGKSQGKARLAIMNPPPGKFGE